MKKLKLLILLFSLPVLIFVVRQVQQYFSNATGEPANIIVETQNTLGLLPLSWQALAQGGEEKNMRLNQTISLIKPLSPQYIRIDHIFDGYDVISGGKNTPINYNFSKLDLIIEDILNSGAKPMISLSYMPPSISSGDVTDPPTNWSDWQQVVKVTIEHYSGKNNKNIDGVLYEVWNEPDLFGNWKTYGEKDYRQLYSYAIKGAQNAQNVNNFKIGGPATTAFYKNWLNEFVKYVFENNLRLDFFSWHKYSLDPQAFIDDVNYVDSLLAQHGGSYLLPKYITEWGSNPENSVIHDGDFDAGHTVAVIRQILGRADLAFNFEIIDGKSPDGKQFWGRWGILANDLTIKPRYQALKLLNNMVGQRIKLSGEGTWVTGFAAKDGNVVRIILANYDKDSVHAEAFPVTFTGLTAGDYKLSQTGLDGKTLTTTENVTGDSFTKTIFLPVNNVVLLELNPLF